MEKSVILYSYYSPEELTGIGKYNGELIDWLFNRKLGVTSFTNVPFYPYWKKYDGFKNHIYSKRNGKTTDVRTWVYIPRSPRALKKIVSELSFLLSSSIVLLLHLKTIKKASLLIVINPPFFLGVLALLIRKLSNTPILFHIQDLQIDAAKELKLLPAWLCIFLEKIECQILKRTDYVSTISKGMQSKIDKKSIEKEVLLIPNWADLNVIKPLSNSIWLHEYLGVDPEKKLIVYSGNVGEKQGLELMVEAARKMQSNKKIHFVLLGEGLYKRVIEKRINEYGLSNFSIHSLVSKDRINDMLNSSFVQLVIQKSEGSDSFLPSKLANILAAGCACIVTASPKTTLYDIIEESKIGTTILPDSSDSLVIALKEILVQKTGTEQMKKRARLWAEQNLSIDKCLKPILDILS